MSSQPPNVKDSSYERFSYLFDNIEAEMAAIYVADGPVATLKSRIESLYRAIDNHAAYRDRLGPKFQEAQALVESLERQLVDAKRDLGVVHGMVKGAVASIAHAKRTIKSRELDLARRQKQLLLNETRRRLSAIGRDLKRNVGRRAGGGFDIVKVDAPVRVPYVPQKQTNTEHEDPTEPKDRVLLCPPDGEQTHQPENQEPDGSTGPGQSVTS